MTFRLTAFLLVAAFCVAHTGLASTASVDDAALRKKWEVDESTRLYFRRADGSSLSEPDFLRAVNQGQGYSVDQPAYNGKLVFVMGQPVAWGLVPLPDGHASKLEKGALVPPFELTTVDGRPVSNAMFKGKVTLIDFFSYGCGPCLDEIPALNAYKAAHPDVQTLAVAPDNDIYIRDLVKHERFAWPTAANAAPFFRDLGLWGTPTLALIDEQGRLLATRLGPIKAPGSQSVTEGSIDQWVQSHIAAQH
ncbi:TlpA disulfide reductase family protein [Dyella sp. C11]|uniref:TlpA family protein disulfide reductase n=1 Tax=Dyella sp. C11 TaxID=2126991 RepID=UPI000D65A16A|nr:TlpA disulfide reductase family protein [Dyella sp. C11]